MIRPPRLRAAIASLALVSVALAGCASHFPPSPVRHARQPVSHRSAIETGSIRDDHLKWCTKRFEDSQRGARPGGAETIEQKQADDKFCSEILNQSKGAREG
jgi:hypothetical protein